MKRSKKLDKYVRVESEEDAEYTSLETDKPFTTSDLGCAAALYCLGHTLAGLDRANEDRVLFEFEPTKAVRFRAIHYWDGNLQA